MFFFNLTPVKKETKCYKTFLMKKMEGKTLKPDIFLRVFLPAGFPKYDPHGDPIPSANGELGQVRRITLTEVEEGKSCQVTGVKDSSTLFLQYLQQIHVGIGTKIKVIQKIAFDGSVSISLKKDHQLSVSKKFSDNILVTY